MAKTKLFIMINENIKELFKEIFKPNEDSSSRTVYFDKDSSYFKNIRQSHSKSIGNYHNGERIVSTYYKRINGIDVPYFKTETKKEYKNK